MLASRVRQTSRSTGTGDLSLDDAVATFRTFLDAGAAARPIFYYVVNRQHPLEWECGEGLIVSELLQRTTVLEGSNGTNRVDFTNGVKDIFCGLPASRALYVDASDQVLAGEDGRVILDRQAFRAAPNAVVSGLTVPTATRTLTVTLPGGLARFAGYVTSIAGQTFTFANAAASGVIRARRSTRQLDFVPFPVSLPSSDDLILCEVYVNPLSNPSSPGVYAIYDRRTKEDDGHRGSLDTLGQLRASVVMGGVYDGALRQGPVGDIVWYFGNLALVPFCDDPTMASLIEGHLNAQVRLLYGSQGTNVTDWTTLHGTPHTDQIRWPYDVTSTNRSTATDFTSGTIAKKRADSHDAYAATFARLAVRYAQVGGAAGQAWWSALDGGGQANYQAVYDALYWNCIVRTVTIPGAGGALTTTFQDPSLYGYLLTIDNFEVYQALAATSAYLGTLTGAPFTTWAPFLATWAGNVLNGLRAMWRWQAGDENARGEIEYAACYWDVAAGRPLLNDHQRWYPDLVVYGLAPLYGVTWHTDPDINRRRMNQGYQWLIQYAPFWWRSRNYDLFPWAALLAGAAAMGFRSYVDEGIAFIQNHHALGEPQGTLDWLQVDALGHIQMAIRLLAGDTF